MANWAIPGLIWPGVVQFEKKMTIHLTFRRQIQTALIYFDKRNAERDGPIQAPTKKRKYQRQLAAGQSKGVGMQGKVNFMRRIDEHSFDEHGNSIPINQAIYQDVSRRAELTS